MSRKTERPTNGEPRDAHPEESDFTVKDRRHWTNETDDDGDDGDTPEAAPAEPTIIGEYRQRAEQAEQKLHEYIDAFKEFRSGQEEVRARLNRDVERKVELQFGELVGDLLHSVDDLDLALAHVGNGEGAQNLANGVQMVRKRFIDTLVRHGIERMEPDGEVFDPNTAEAIRVDPVDDDAKDGTITK
ncbi:MAG: nucleotide exchange factor GrpE, partial [Planctomycetota bacterium]|nr:nucleotide exchange factor GrpE [Planctomycetota bacterium]